MKSFIAYWYCIVIAGLVGCSSNDDPAYRQADALPPYLQANFQQYVGETQQWLAQNRDFKSSNHQLEINLNSPFELKPEFPNGQAVLLVHGLGDSPYSFHDIAAHLVQQGYLVRSVLLPGHGSKAGDLLLPDFNDWQQVVAHHIQLLHQHYPTVWLGGYSTGANLVTSYALHNENVAGLLLFSPAFKPKSAVVKWARLASYFVDWADQDPEDNVLRYNSLPMNGAAVYYDTVKAVQSDLRQHKFNRPVMMVVSASDSVIDVNEAVNIFENTFTHPNNKLIWQGHFAPRDGVISQSMTLPKLRISNGSHMGMLFRPDNPYYGQHGSITICQNGQSSIDYSACRQGAQVWYSAWGYQEPDKIHARLTFNPYFDDMVNIMDNVMSNENKQY